MSRQPEFDIAYDNRPYGLPPEMEVYEYATRVPWRRSGDWSFHKTRQNADRSQARNTGRPFEMWQRAGSGWVLIHSEGIHDDAG